jgi:addiction module HigA family antidote
MTAEIEPPMPGSVLRDQVVPKLGIRQADLADAMGLSRVYINHLLTGKNPLSPNVALRLARVTSTDAAYWLGLQSAYDLYKQEQTLRETLEGLPMLMGPSSTYGAPWSPEEIERVKALLDSGESIAEVGAAIGRSYYAVAQDVQKSWSSPGPQRPAFIQSTLI